MKCSGNGTPIAGADDGSSSQKIAALTTVAANTKLLKNLRIDEHAEKLCDTVRADAALGRMSRPVCLKPEIFMQQDLGGRCFSKAFTVEQGAPVHSYVFPYLCFVHPFRSQR